MAEHTSGAVDPAVLDWPFFTDRHRETAAALQRWTAENADLWPGDGIHPDRPGAAARAETEILRALGAGGWFGFLTDPGAPDLRSICLTRQILAHADDLADHAFAIQTLAGGAIARYGDQRQRARYLPGLAGGETIASFAVSEPGAGSDVSAVALRAERTATGYRLDGRKSWIAHADIADVHCVIARTGEGPGALGLTAFLVPADSPGLRVHPVTPIAPRSFGDLEFTGCEVDGQAVLGGSGTGFVVAMDTLERARVTVGAAALGFARRAAQAAVGHVRQRRIYGGRLLDLQLVKASLADIRISLEAMTLLVARAAWEADRDGPEFATHSSIAKAHATESAQQIVDAAVQLSGAAGLVAGSLPERLYRQVRSLRVYEGATEVQKMVIADATARWGPW